MGISRITILFSISKPRVSRRVGVVRLPGCKWSGSLISTHRWLFHFNLVDISLDIPLFGARTDRGGFRGQEPAAARLSGGAVYHPGTAMYHSTTAPSPRNLGSQLPCITPLPLPCITPPIGPQLPKVTRCVAAQKPMTRAFRITIGKVSP